MKAQRLYSRLAVALLSAGIHGNTAAVATAAWTPSRHVSAESTLPKERHAGVLDDDKDALPAADPVHAEEDGAEEPHRASLASQLLPYVYSPSSDNGHAHLSLPIDHVSLRRIKNIMRVKSKEDLNKALCGVGLLETPESCIRYINLTVSYIRQLARMEEQAQSTSIATRHRAASLQRQLRGLQLSGQERSAMLRKACHLAEERRVPLVVASRLLRFRWPDTLSTSAGGVRQSYVMDLVRSWATESLQRSEIEPRDARALLGNCAYALKSAVRRLTRDQSTDALGEISSFIGALAMTASQDMHSPAKAEGLVALMWAVHLTGCPAPASFWDTMVQRVVDMNKALGAEFSSGAEEASAKDRRPTSASGLSPSPPSAKLPRVGHFFSTLTTRQLYRFLMVLKLIKWDGSPTVLHHLADQALRNIAFELEASNFQRHATTKSEGHGEGEQGTLAKASIKPFSAVGATEIPLELTQQKAVHLPRSVAVNRIRQVADLKPNEFLELLYVAGELGVPFGVSASRMADELLTPLVQHLNAKELILLLQVVRHTRSQSSGLLQAVIDRLVEHGATGPYALPLAKGALKTAARAPTVFQSVCMDNFVDLFTTTCEVQHTLVRATEVAAMGDILYTLSRRYEETSLQGQRIREIVNLLCAQMDRLIQLQVTSSSTSDRLLECTVLLRMRSNKALYPAVQELLASRAVAVERAEHRREARQKRAIKWIQAQAERAVEGQRSSRHSESPRWEELAEDDLPQVARAALSVYSEFVYMFERMITVKAVLTARDYELFSVNIKKAGLYSILQGAQLFQRGHLEALLPYTTPLSQAAAQEISHVLPTYIEKTVANAVLARLSSSRFSASDTDDEVLKVLGHVHCDAAKVDAVICMLVQSPLRKLQQQRPVWLYVAELARRFGSEATKKSVSVYLKKALY
ncbi:hypothetical protein JKF63_03799 [Porcisia hertigi]|uniref:Uncharacterized protein n=1 Tax=Porcisia hertigi TaxID=2761500 RepID=A0A836I6D1_9TRYP|nr:hypothetical protein JKF63_03799 [Porcisia hertigi]